MTILPESALRICRALETQCTLRQLDNVLAIAGALAETVRNMRPSEVREYQEAKQAVLS